MGEEEQDKDRAQRSAGGERSDSAAAQEALERIRARAAKLTGERPTWEELKADREAGRG